MSKSDRAKKRDRKRYHQPSAPGSWKRPSADRVEANDNHANDNEDLTTIGGVKITDSQRYRLRVAQDRLASDDLGNRRLGQMMLEAIGKELASVVAEGSVALALEERRALEALRGHVLEKSDIEGAIGVARIVNDGLEVLRSRKGISQTQYDAGQRFRVDYEKMNPERELTPKQLDPAKVTIPHGGENWDNKKGEAIDRIMCVYRMICGVEGRPGEKGMLPLLPREHPAMRSIQALNMIAGQGFTINELTTASRARARMKVDLAFALDAVAIVHDLAPDNDFHPTS